MSNINRPVRSQRRKSRARSSFRRSNRPLPRTRLGLGIALWLLALPIMGLLIWQSHQASTQQTVEAASPNVVAVGDDLFFVEDFKWLGNHAATIKGGVATTVWWNEDAWDVRSDTSHNSATAHGGNEHADIHRSVSDLGSALQENTLNIIGGNGDAGVGVMHLDFEGIISARLRNPMRISQDKPGIVEFRTSNFVTTGHWWEIAIAPANQTVTGGEYTAVPSVSDHFGGSPGAGHRPAQDSINYVTIGADDVPCQTGWRFANGVTTSINGVTNDIFGPVIPTDPSQKDVLFAWRLEFYPDKIKAFVDLDRDGTKELHHVFNVTVPWSEVYVYLLGVAYQADHHPQGECFQGQMRELPWKDVRIGPVKYARTSSHPKNQGAVHVPQKTGWVKYDLRDTQRFGPANAIPPQPNTKAYDKFFDHAICNGGWYGCGVTTTSKTLKFDLPAWDALSIAQAKLIYDIRRTGTVTLGVNGTNVGQMPGWTTVRGAVDSDKIHWAQRSIDVSPSLLRAGENTITLNISGDVALDRMHFEFVYGDGAAPLPQPSPTPTSSPAPGPGPVQWLSVQGNKIVNESGNTVVLRGVNIENREWIWGSSQSLDNLIAYERKAIPKATGAPPDGWGANVVLLAVASGPINRNDQLYLSALDELVSLAKASGAYTLLVYRYAEPNSQQANIPDQAAEDAMAALAGRYKGEPAVLYGLQVEPHDVTWSQLKPRFTTMIDAIRAKNPRALIAVPGTQWGRDITHALTDPIQRDNLIYKTHPYDTWSTIQKGYRLSEIAVKYPVLIGEFGAGAFMGLADVVSLLDFAEANGISWTGWLFHSVGCPCMLSNSSTFDTTEYGAVVKQRLQQAASSGGSGGSTYKVLVFHKAAQFVHDSIPVAVQAIKQLGSQHGFAVDATADASVFTDSNLAQYKAVVFLHTHQEVLDDSQQQAFERYIRSGGGYAGIHLASGTEYNWAWYGGLVGARFNFHPPIQQAVVRIEDKSHPSTAGLPDTWTRTDEWYNFFDGPSRNKVRVLATVDESTYSGGEHGADHPIAWCQVYDGGRSWYTGMGHLKEHYSDALFLSHILGGIEYAAGVKDADCSPRGTTPSPTPSPAPTPEQPGSLVTGATALSGRGYSVATGLGSASLVYTDRTYTYTSVPEILQGASYIRTANDDKSATQESFLSISLSSDATIFVGYDTRATSLPSWLASWQDTGLSLQSTDTSFRLYSKDFPKGTASLGANLAAGAAFPSSSLSNYVLAATAPSQPSTPLLSVASADATVGQSISLPIVLSAAPAGLSGFDLSISLTGDGLELREIALPDFGLSSKELLSPTQARLSAADANGLVSPGHSAVTLATVSLLAKHEGSASISILIHRLDDEQGQDIQAQPVSGTIRVLNASPSLDQVPDLTLEVGQPLERRVSITDPGDSAWSVSIDYGDGSQQQLAVSSPSFSLEHSYQAAGSYTVIVRVRDDEGAEAALSFLVAVRAVFPTLSGMAGPVADLDGDGLAEDLNANGRLDFADVVALFERMDSAELISHAHLFDFNRNGRLDMADVISLFDRLLPRS